jgi:hypothetical protein
VRRLALADAGLLPAPPPCSSTPLRSNLLTAGGLPSPACAAAAAAAAAAPKKRALLLPNAIDGAAGSRLVRREPPPSGAGLASVMLARALEIWERLGPRLAGAGAGAGAGGVTASLLWLGARLGALLLGWLGGREGALLAGALGALLAGTLGALLAGTLGALLAGALGALLAGRGAQPPLLGTRLGSLLLSWLLPGSAVADARLAAAVVEVRPADLRPTAAVATAAPPPGAAPGLLVELLAATGLRAAAGRGPLVTEGRGAGHVTRGGVGGRRSAARTERPRRLGPP